jgi:hypothetical protein
MRLSEAWRREAVELRSNDGRGRLSHMILRKLAQITKLGVKIAQERSTCGSRLRWWLS